MPLNKLWGRAGQAHSATFTGFLADRPGVTFAFYGDLWQGIASAAWHVVIWLLYIFKKEARETEKMPGEKKLADSGQAR